MRGELGVEKWRGMRDELGSLGDISE